METLELFYPRITAQAGGYTFQQGIEIEVSSARDSRMDWAKIRFTDRFKPEISISRLEPATILLGYGGAFDEVFTGYVGSTYNAGSNADEIILKDPMLLLEGLTVNETFLDTTPQEVIRYILAQAGLTELKLTSTVYPARKRLSIRRQSGVQALDTVAAAWNIQVPYFCSGGVFYWGEQPEQTMTYTFEAGRNILSTNLEFVRWVYFALKRRGLCEMLLTSTTTWLSLFILGVSALFFCPYPGLFFH